jgi:hypothetical protein
MRGQLLASVISRDDNGIEILGNDLSKNPRIMFNQGSNRLFV